MRIKNIYTFLLFSFLTSFVRDLKAADIESTGEVKLVYTNKADSTPSCREIQCKVFIHVVKSKQKLFLYVDGNPVDSFAASTGHKNHPTPDINMHPNGPTFEKYTSRKYPGGNYQGLGNMPYVVFVQGGYAIHGTTPGNFLKLGHRASHGCIRLHPNDAKKVYELVNLHGLQNTWVKVNE